MGHSLFGIGDGAEHRDWLSVCVERRNSPSQQRIPNGHGRDVGAHRSERGRGSSSCQAVAVLGNHHAAQEIRCISRSVVVQGDSAVAELCSRATSSCLRTFPLSVRGKASTKKTDTGTLYDASWLRPCSRKSSSVTAAFDRSHLAGTSPRRSSGTPATTASVTAE